eukprot:TRINITY_DN3320_c0_g1_i1.p1 TRINITY_DN3320_c0_g1~~TRINITY_DN3320_c0_g1_i1.p1  ORF type:complete len:670 (+),score=155.26 TRINITY_DN3320_c0_g1_i1:150-2012(+)
MPEPFRVVVIGGGITGLTAAWELERTLGAGVQVDIIECDSRAGGWLRTDQVGSRSIQVELGPRSFRTAAAGAYTLRVIDAVGGIGRLVQPDKRVSSRRMVWLNGKLNEVSLWYAIRTVGPLALLREFLNFVPRPPATDESVEAFATRRFGPAVLPLFQAVCNGIFAGPISRLSLSACFPAIARMEKASGSLIRAGILSLFRRSSPEVPLPPKLQRTQQASTLYSFRDGMESLPKLIRGALGTSCRVHCDSKVTAMSPGRVTVETGGKTVDVSADAVITTLSPTHLAPLVRTLASCKRPPKFEVGGGMRLIRNRTFRSGTVLRQGSIGKVTRVEDGPVEVIVDGICFDLLPGEAEPHEPCPLQRNLAGAALSLSRVSHSSVALVTIAGDSSAISVPEEVRGFGFLVPDGEVLGCTMDALTFPAHHQDHDEGDAKRQVLTVMIGGDHDRVRDLGGPKWLSNTDLRDQAVASIERYAGVKVDRASPSVTVKQTVAALGIPQYAPGHAEMMAGVRSALLRERVIVAGMAVRGVGVNDSIASGVAAAAEAIAIHARKTGDTLIPAFDRESAAFAAESEQHLLAERRASRRRLVCRIASAAGGGVVLYAAAVGGYIAGHIAVIRRS